MTNENVSVLHFNENLDRTIPEILRGKQLSPLNLSHPNMSIMLYLIHKLLKTVVKDDFIFHD